MDILRVTRNLSKQLIGIRISIMTRFLIQWLILSVVITSCKSDPTTSNWLEGDALTIGQYLEKNKNEYSKFNRILVQGKLLSTLYAYNPYGDDYTLFLPTDEAIDHFIQNRGYGNFEEFLKDTSFIKVLTRYHTLNRKVHTDEFPDGGLIDRTLTGERLVASFFKTGENQLIKINNTVPIIQSNLKMTNGYIQVISGVLQKVDISGYDWLQQQKDYSILAQAMELSGIRKKLGWNKYTIFAEPDSIYHRYGINNINDLIKRIATPGLPYSNLTNSFYQFTAYHILNGEYYLNDLSWGSKKYLTLSNQLIMIVVGLEIKINTGVDIYGTKISQSGETIDIDYIRPLWEGCNILTRTGPVHSITDMLYFKPLP